MLTLMIAVLALSGIAMQLIAGEDRHIALGALIAPFILLALPAMAVVAAIAVLFETIPFLRGGFGNVAYFFLWTAGLSVPLATGRHASDLVGISVVADSARNAAHLSLKDGGVTFSLAFGPFDKLVSTFVWEGLAWTPEIIISRLAWLSFALFVILLSSFLFDRFDPSRTRALRGVQIAPPPESVSVSPQNVVHVPEPVRTAGLTPLPARRSPSRFLAIVVAELRLMLNGQKWWWYVVAIGLAIASAIGPSESARGMMLAFAWIWPVLLWSSMGVREIREQTYQLIFSAPQPLSRQLPSAWLAGVLLALLTGSGFGLRVLFAGHVRSLVAWLIGALFIPTLALTLGVSGGSGKAFEIIYTLLWYIGPLHAMPALDFMGSAPTTATTHYPLIYLAVAMVLAVGALAGRARQLHS